MADLLLTELAGLPVLVSPRLAAAGVPHAFTTRQGGESRPPYDSLNLGFGTGDDAAAVVANRARVCAALGFDPAALRFVRQVHGAVLHEPGAPWSNGPEPEPPAGDGLLTGCGDLLIGVRVADCLAVLLATPEGRHVAAVHAGWRGLAAGILPAAVDALCRRSGRAPGDLLAAVGVAIGPARYEVGPEVAAHFPASCLSTGPSGRAHLAVAACGAQQLRAAGVHRIDAVARCTFEEPAWFYSHRRDGPQTGRQAALIAPRR